MHNILKVIKEFKPIYKLKEELISFLQQRENISERNLSFIVSPYRISPLGAHIDHQGGPVLGMTIEAYTVLAFVPAVAPKVRLHSMNYPGVVEFNLQQVGSPDMNDWGRYARGATKALGDIKTLSHGFLGAVNGTLPSSGLSSSASVGLSYLYALARVNELDISTNDFIRLDRSLENEYLGLQNGILDQATILNGRKDHLLYINTLSAEVKSVERPNNSDDFKIIIVHSGFSRELTSSGFNTRVEECKMVSRLLGQNGGIESANALSDIPEEVYKQYRAALPKNLMKRADHYFSEVRCVEDAFIYWRHGNWVEFGRLMKESCNSSIENYESGSPALIELQRIFSETNGVYGSRFCGGGYGGCVMAFVKPEFSDEDSSKLLENYLSSLPEAEGRAAVYRVKSDEGIRFL
ncbi:MAG: galactokinase family protein [Thermodesulfobacteriota bacterium]